MRDEFPYGTQLDSLLEAQVLTGAWRIDCDNHRPLLGPLLAHPGRVRRALGPTHSSYSSRSGCFIRQMPSSR
jgi:hypothetical protein